MATGGVINATGTAAPDAWKRILAYFIQACLLYTSDAADE